MIGLIIIFLFVLVFALELADVKREKERRFGMKSNRYK
tara:strand:- start:243 stop:356 length:114 start_codon:yes stop_codon:yes gene_type:complete